MASPALAFRQAPAPVNSSDHTIRRCQRMLRMVSELHKRGFQRLRVMPHIYGGSIWRLALASRDSFSNRVGLALTIEGLEHAPQYSSASQNHPFGWQDAENDDARALATKMIERFPDLLAECVGRDWDYAGWFNELMGWVEAGFLPLVNPMHEVTGTGVDPLTLVATPLCVNSSHDIGANRCPLPPIGAAVGRPVQMA